MSTDFKYDPKITQKRIDIFKENSDQWHVLISDGDGPGVLGKFDWKDETTISSVSCVSVRGLKEVTEVKIITTSSSERLEFTLGDSNTASLLVHTCSLNMTKGKDYFIQFQKLPAVQGGGNGSILSRPKHLDIDEVR
jgi:hypothetical protein